MKKIKSLIHSIIDVFEAILVAGLKIMPGRPPRRFLFFEDLRHGFQFDSDLKLSYVDFSVPTFPDSQIRCYVHPQDIRSGWILDRVSNGSISRPDLLICFCRTAIQELFELQVLIDLGANYGEYFACSTGLCEYVGVEPNPILGSLLLRTAKTGTIINQAVIPNNKPEDETLILNINPFYSGASSLKKKTNRTMERGLSTNLDDRNTLRIPVSGIHVDNIMKKNVKSGSGFYVKVDIEGIDVEIVRDILADSRARRSIIQMELNEEDLASTLDTLEQIATSHLSNDFRCIRLFHKIDDDILSQCIQLKTDFREFLFQNSLPLSDQCMRLKADQIRLKGYSFGELIIIGNDLF